MSAVLEDLRSDEVSLDIAIVGDRAMRSLNRRFRKIDETTDVLSFPSGPTGSDGPGNPDSEKSVPPLELDHIGDIVISIDEARRQAEEDAVALDVAIDRLLIHGVLHLHGFDHHTARDAARMRRKENRLLEKLHGAGLPGYAGP
ncbi:MAG: rRNA maturation RNase YbeY [bacterium]